MCLMTVSARVSMTVSARVSMTVSARVSMTVSARVSMTVSARVCKCPIFLLFHTLFFVFRFFFRSIE